MNSQIIINDQSLFQFPNKKEVKQTFLGPGLSLHGVIFKLQLANPTDIISNEVMLEIRDPSGTLYVHEIDVDSELLRQGIIELPIEQLNIPHPLKIGEWFMKLHIRVGIDSWRSNAMGFKVTDD